MPKLDQFGTCQIFVMGPAHDVAFAGDLERKFIIGLFMNLANFRDQGDDATPFEVMRRGMAEYLFERASVRAGQGKGGASRCADVVVGWSCFHDAFLTG